MPAFSTSSRQRLDSCHIDIVKVCEEAIKIYDFSVLVGHRDQKAQEDAFNGGFSKLHWPESKHNVFPSMAIDLSPYPVIWSDHEEFYYLAGLIIGIASKMGITLRWGGRWKSFPDLPHFELL